MHWRLENMKIKLIKERSGRSIRLFVRVVLSFCALYSFILQQRSQWTKSPQWSLCHFIEILHRKILCFCAFLIKYVAYLSLAFCPSCIHLHTEHFAYFLLFFASFPGTRQYLLPPDSHWNRMSRFIMFHEFIDFLAFLFNFQRSICVCLHTFSYCFRW